MKRKQDALYTILQPYEEGEQDVGTRYPLSTSKDVSVDLDRQRVRIYPLIHGESPTTLTIDEARCLYYVLQKTLIQEDTEENK